MAMRRSEFSTYSTAVLVRTTVPSPGRPGVLAHGDLWRGLQHRTADGQGAEAAVRRPGAAAAAQHRGVHARVAGAGLRGVAGVLRRVDGLRVWQALSTGRSPR